MANRSVTLDCESLDTNVMQSASTWAGPDRQRWLRGSALLSSLQAEFELTWAGNTRPALCWPLSCYTNKRFLFLIEIN